MFYEFWVGYLIGEIMKFINLDELERRIKLINKPTPYDVLDIIGKMKEELK